MPKTCRVLKQNKIGIINAPGWLFKKEKLILTSRLPERILLK
jgi:hypothetical protein